MEYWDICDIYTVWRPLKHDKISSNFLFCPRYRRFPLAYNTDDRISLLKVIYLASLVATWFFPLTPLLSLHRSGKHKLTLLAWYSELETVGMMFWWLLVEGWTRWMASWIHLPMTSFSLTRGFPLILFEEVMDSSYLLNKVYDDHKGQNRNINWILIILSRWWKTKT